MNILCDFHHSDLWWSHHLILEKGLGHTLFRPRGMEWFEHKYYYQSSPAVAKQFLQDSYFTLEAAAKFPLAKVSVPDGDISNLRASGDTINGCPYYPFMRTLTFDEFKDTQIDVIMPTLANNQEPWLKLKNDFKPNAKLLREEGNVNGWASVHPAYRNVLTSDLPTFLRINTPNKLLYHQRFDTERVFTYRAPTVFNRITSFMPGFRGCAELVTFAESHDFSGMEFVDYGHLSKKGFLDTKGKYFEELCTTSFVWHVKPGGDGFGHVIHSSMASGRPVITNADDYRDAIAWRLLVDGKTCILIGRDPIENMKKIRAAANPETIALMCQQAAHRFKECVDYKSEQEQIRLFIERLV